MIVIIIIIIIQDWHMDTLKNCLTENDLCSLRGGESIKAVLIRKLLAADLLQLPVLPSHHEEKIRK